MQLRFDIRPLCGHLPACSLGPAALCGLALWAWTSTAHAHGVEFRIERGEAVVVHFSSHHDGAMVEAGFRVFSPDGRQVFVRGHTDAHGRAVFVPDAPGEWRMLMATEDGHGAEVEIPVGEAEVAAGANPPAAARPDATPPAGRLSATAAGVGYLLGLGGLLALWRRRR